MKSAAAVFLCVILLPAISFADAVLYVSPERGTYTIGQTFQVQVFADSGGSLINAAEGDMAFNSDALEVVNVSTEKSILESWSTPPEFSNEEGTVHFAGWTRNNFNGVNGLLVTITFKALKTMPANARLAAGAILAADGQESNIITSMRSGIFNIKPDEQTSAAADIQSDSSASSSPISAKLPAPVFGDYADRIAVGDRLVIRGNAEPNSAVNIFMAHGTEHEEKTQVLSASDGSFTYVSDIKAVEGVYHVRAIIESSDGRHGIPSDTIDITAAPVGVAATAIFGASLIFEIIPFFALLIFGGLGAAYIYHRHQLAKMHYGRQSVFDQK